MKIKNYVLILFVLVLGFYSCKSDDDLLGVTVAPPRDRSEVYGEDIIEIETYLETHYYNYEDFDFAMPYDNVANDAFEIIINEIPEGNPDNVISLFNSPELKFKLVEDPTDETIVYKLYYLEVREGLGEQLYPSDEAFLTYEGFTTDNSVPFDSKVTPVPLNLTTVNMNIIGVVDGFREGLIEFKGATDYTDNGDGTFTYRNQGIGMIFVPSGIGYFSNPPNTDIGAYEPLIFKINLVESIHTDFDADTIPSYLEDLDGDNDVFNDNTDGDALPNFVDADDDNDGLATKDEIQHDTYIVNLTQNETEPEIQDPEFELRRKTTTDESTGDEILTIYTVTLLDSNDDGTPDYLDSNTTIGN